MNQNTKTPRLPAALVSVLAVVGLGTLLGGCVREDYYCDDQTGRCYYCDGVGCSVVQPPTRPVCRGDYECPAGQRCTTAGCTTSCRTNTDCARGWVCRGGSGTDAGTATGTCVAPNEPIPTPNPGTCRSNSDCGGGYICSNGSCLQSPTPACTSDSQCTGGQVCVSGRCTAPTNTCQFDNQCGPGRLCVNSECRTRCGSGGTACPTGQECATVGGVSFCRLPQTSSCTRDSECASGQRCLNGTCLQSCTPGSNSCGSAELYCTDDGVCAPDTRPRPFCDSTRPCTAPSQCVSGVCRNPCTTSPQCRMIDGLNYRNCGPIPNVSASGTFCLTDNEFNPNACRRQSDCSQGQSCIDGACR